MSVLFKVKKSLDPTDHSPTKTCYSNDIKIEVKRLQNQTNNFTSVVARLDIL